MTVDDVVKTLNLKVFCGEEGLSRQVENGYTSDLLSDVMGHADAGSIWITLQSHINIMAVASLKELAGIVLVKGNKPDEDTIRQSNIEGMPILGTDLEAFEISGRLYQLIRGA